MSNRPRLSLVGAHRPGKWRCASVEDGSYGPCACVGTGYSALEAYRKWWRNTPEWKRRFGFRHPPRAQS